jgi:galactokinase
MTLRESKRQNWRRLALVLPPVLIVLFAIAISHHTSNSLWAQGKPKPEAQAKAPKVNQVEVQRLVSLKTQFLEELNSALQNPDAQARMHIIFHKKIGPEWVEESLFKFDRASVKVTEMSHAQLEELRDVSARQIDEAIKLEQAGKGGAKLLGEGAIRNHVFTGKLRPVSGPVTLQPANSQ